MYMDTQRMKRVKSFTWRLGALLVVTALAYVSDNVGMLELSPMATAVIALLASEGTKYINGRWSA